MGVVYVADSAAVAAVAMVSDAVFSDAGRPLQMFVFVSIVCVEACLCLLRVCVCFLFFFWLAAASLQ